MSIMGKRAEMIGASVVVQSAPGEGTEVMIVYPHEN